MTSTWSRLGFCEAALIASMWLAAFASTAEAAASRFDFTLTSPTSLQSNDGRGFFIIDDPIPGLGTAVLVASDLSGTVGNSWLFSPPAPFGYAFGNTFEFLAGDPAQHNVDLIRSPHEDALVTFIDGAPVGISYTESHTCNTGHHCASQFTNAVPFLSMDGSQYFASAAFLDGTGGFITITPAVPESGTVPLLLAGLAALQLFSSMTRRSRRLPPRVPDVPEGACMTEHVSWRVR